MTDEYDVLVARIINETLELAETLFEYTGHNEGEIDDVLAEIRPQNGEVTLDAAFRALNLLHQKVQQWQE